MISNPSTERKYNHLKLPKLLNHYESADFVIRLKARFVYYLELAMITVLFLAVLSTVFVQSRNPIYSGHIYWPIIGIELAVLFIHIGCFILLIKGYFETSTHLLLAVSFIAVWYILFADRNINVSRFDTIVYAVAIIAMTPILLGRKKWMVVFITVASLVLLVVFTITITSRINIGTIDYIEYLFDNAIAFTIVGIVAYNIFNINKISLDKLNLDLQERKLYEEKLLESETKYRDLTESLPQTVFESDINGNLSYVNKIGFDVFGYKLEDLVRGINILDTLAPEEHLRAKENIRSIIQKSGHVGNRYMAIRKDRSRFPAIIYTSLVEKDGMPAGFRGIIIDISDREKAQDALKQSEARFRNLFEAAPVSMVQLSLSGEILRFNNEAHRVLGYDQTDIPDLNVWWQKAYPDPVYREQVKTLWNTELEKAIANRTNVVPMEFRITNKSGKELIMLVGASYMEDSVVISLFDISERKKAEYALKESEELFKNLIMALPYGVVLTDIKGLIIKVNKAYCNDIGLPENLVVNKTILEIGVKYDEKQVEKIKDEMRKFGFCENIEIDMVDSSGLQKTFINSSRLISIFDQTLVLSASVNISDRKRIENELNNYRINLENLVQERTDELNNMNASLKIKNSELQKAIDNLGAAHQQLVESDKMATLGVLAAGIAHEINNPLNFIYGGILGIEDYFDQNLKEHQEAVLPLIEAINTGIERATKIVSSLNHFSRQTDSTAEKCDIHSIIDNCIIMLENQIKYKAEVIKHYTSDSFELYGNDGKLHQAFLNILSNAVHAITEKGTIIVTTRIVSGHLVIWFSDSGTGISKQHLDRIFEPFFTTKAPGIGSGLGLSITYNIITEHQGKIEVTSEENKGTTFKIWLPLKS